MANDFIVKLSGQDNLSSQLDRIKTKFTQIQDQSAPLERKLKQLKTIMSQMQLSPELANSQVFKQMQAEAANYADAIGDTQQAIKMLSNDTATLQAGIQAFQGLAAAANVYVGVLGMVGVEDENVKQTIVKLQSAQNILNGVNTIANILNKDSILVLKAKQIQQAVMTATTIKATVAEGANTVATTANTLATNSWNVAKAVAKALLGDFSGLLIVAAAGLASYALFTDNSTESTKKNTKVIKEQKDAINDEIKTLARQVTVLNEDIIKIRTFNGTKEQEKQLVNELNTRYKESFGYYSTLKGWYDTLTSKSQQYVEQLRIETKARILLNQYQSNMEKSMQIDDNIANGKYGNLSPNGTESRMTPELQKALQERNQLTDANKRLEEQINDLYSQRSTMIKNMNNGKSAPTTTTNSNDSKELNEQINKQKELIVTLQEQQRQVHPLSEEYAILKQKINEANQELVKLGGTEVDIKFFDELANSEETIDSNIAILKKYREQLDITSEAYQKVTKELEKWENIRKGNSLGEDIEITNGKTDTKSNKNSEVTFYDKFKGISNGIHDVDSLKSSVESLSEAIKDNASAWDIFMASFNVIENAIETYAGLVQITKMFKMAQDAANISKETDIALGQVATATNMSETSSELALTSAESGEAIAGATKSGAKLAFPYNLVAIAAGVAAVVAALSMVGSFANGGIISGGSAAGDMLYARVNSGEMILSGSQQKRLFNVLDGHGAYSQGGTQNVKFKIEGRDLVATLNTHNKIRNL